VVSLGVEFFENYPPLEKGVILRYLAFRKSKMLTPLG
jgi:hypothetical protein